MSADVPQVGVPTNPVAPVKLNLLAYIKENEAQLMPPVCNKMIHNDGKLRVMVVGGPNQRKDYHLNLGEELFFQIKGDMCLKIMESGEPKDIVIKEGEIFVLPGGIAHSPQRFEGTIGLVIERVRAEGELDGLRYYVDESNKTVLWQRFFYTYNLGAQLKPLIEEYFSSAEFKTRVPSPDMPPSAWEPDDQTLVPPPYSLEPRFSELRDGGQPLRLFHKPVKEFVVDLVGGETKTPALPIDTECYVWMLAGQSTVNESLLLNAMDTALIPSLDSWTLEPGARALLVYTLAV